MAKKLTKRKAVSFLRSYYDVLNEIPKKEDKIDFFIICIRQTYLRIKTQKDLNFIVNLKL